MAQADKLSGRTLAFTWHPKKGVLRSGLGLGFQGFVSRDASHSLLAGWGVLLFLASIWSYFLPLHFPLDKARFQFRIGFWQRPWPWLGFARFFPPAGGSLLLREEPVSRFGSFPSGQILWLLAVMAVESRVCRCWLQQEEGKS